MIINTKAKKIYTAFQVNSNHTLPLDGSNSIIMDPGQWFASKHVTSIPEILIFWLRGKTCSLSHAIPIFIFTSFAVIREQYIFP